MNPMNGLSITSALALIGAASCALLAGCKSTEVYTYRSSAFTPQTVTLVDVTSGEPLWAVDVPVGQQLDLRFTERESTAEGFGSDTMRWTLSPIGQNWKGAVSELRVPPPSARRLDVSLRPGGEARTAPVIESAKMPRGNTMPSPIPGAPTTPAASPDAPPATIPMPDPAIVLPDPKQPAPNQTP
jgi:hypothetical protein